LLFFFQAEDGIRDGHVTGVQTCALPISTRWGLKVRSPTTPPATEPSAPSESPAVPAPTEKPAEPAPPAEPKPESNESSGSCDGRSEERRVGKECRARGSTEQ